jgi:hypothetical protein
MNVFNVVNLDFVPWQSLGCASQFDYYTKLLVATLSPFGVQDDKCDSFLTILRCPGAAAALPAVPAAHVLLRSVTLPCTAELQLHLAVAM